MCTKLDYSLSTILFGAVVMVTHGITILADPDLVLGSKFEKEMGADGDLDGDLDLVVVILVI